MKTIKTIFLTLSLLAVITSCEKDGDKIYLNSPADGELIASQDKVKLTKEESRKIALSLAWTRENFVTSNPDMQAPNLVIQSLQVSTTQDFKGEIIESAENSLSKAYTGLELNRIAKILGLVPDEYSPLFFRLSARTGNNMEPTYSNVMKVDVNSFYMDMTVANVLDANKADTEAKLSSPLEDGHYTGFMGATGWYNWYLQEGDGTVWGNDGVDGSAFLISSEDTQWNLWFPGQSGCYYVDLNTSKKQWSSLYIPTLKVSGGITGEMTFDRKNMKWLLVFNATATGNAKIQISGTGQQYDYGTSTDDASAKETPVAFTADGTTMAFGKEPSDIDINIPATGECTLVLDLNDPKAWTCQAVSGSTTPVEVKQEIFLSGIDDKVNGWTFDNKLFLYDEDKLAYAGVAESASKWGYKIYTEKDNWEDLYSLAAGNADAGTLEYKGANNLPAPADGLYLFDVSLIDLTYKVTAIGDKIYYSGLNDDWTFHELAATATPGVYSGSINITTVSTDGFRLYLQNGDWDTFYGGTDGKLTFTNGHIVDDATWGTGTHTLTVNLKEGTYSIN